MLKVQKISKNYGTKVIFSDISFNLEKGQRAAVMESLNATLYEGVVRTTLEMVYGNL